MSAAEETAKRLQEQAAALRECKLSVIGHRAHEIQYSMPPTHLLAVYMVSSRLPALQMNILRRSLSHPSYPSCTCTSVST